MEKFDLQREFNRILLYRAIEYFRNDPDEESKKY
jgi:hypothetical protein